MSSLTELTLALFLGLALVAALAGLAAWAVSKALLRRRLRAEEAGRAPSTRWSGRDRERVRSKYFEKERRARAHRARRQAPPPRTPPPEESPPGPVNLDRLHRETLGLGSETTPEAVRAAYKARVREYHPDQVARLGAKLRVLAEEETKRINDAYLYFRERYGF